MQHRMRKTTIGLAIGTLLMALLAVSPYGSASKCNSDCLAQEEMLIEAKFKNSVDGITVTLNNPNAYAAAAVRTPKDFDPVPVPAKISKISNKKASENNQKVLKRTLVAILLLVATESHRASVSN